MQLKREGRERGSAVMGMRGFVGGEGDRTGRLTVILCAKYFLVLPCVCRSRMHMEQHGLHANAEYP